MVPRLPLLRPLRRSAAPLLLLALCVFWATPSLAQNAAERRSDGAQVKRVLDGDTVYLEDGRSVRLVGIDAPEMGREGAPDQYFARESRDYLHRLVSGRPVRLEADTQGRDRYHRVLAYVYLPGGQMANEEMVEQGYAFFYPHPHQNSEIQKKLLEAQNRAILSRRGFWPRILALPQPAGGWVGNRRSKRFHHPESRHAKQISVANRVVFYSLEQAFRKGYAPARASSPWPEASGR